MHIPRGGFQTLALASVLLLLGLGGCAGEEPWIISHEPITSIEAQRLDNLMREEAGATFRSQHYLDLAAGLQALPQAEAENLLRTWSTNEKFEYGTIILCRMLFVDKDGGPMKRAPYLGLFIETSKTRPYEDMYGIGSTNGYDWPDFPVAMLNGIPFLIEADYEGPITGTWFGPEGPPPLAPMYVKYCLTEGRWTQQRFTAEDPAARQLALAALLQSPKWKRPLLENEIQYLNYEIASEAGVNAPQMPVYRREQEMDGLTKFNANKTTVGIFDLEHVPFAQAIKLLNVARKAGGLPGVTVEFDEALVRDFSRNPERDLSAMKNAPVTIHQTSGILTDMINQMMEQAKDAGGLNCGCYYSGDKIEIYPGRFTDLVKRLQISRRGIAAYQSRENETMTVEKLLTAMNGGLRDSRFSPVLINGKIVMHDAGKGNPPPKTQIHLNAGDPTQTAAMLKRQISIPPGVTRLRPVIEVLKRQLNLNCFLDDDGNLSLEPKLGAE